MKKRLRTAAFCSLIILCGLSADARAWEDGETFSDKWNSSWKGIGEGLDRAGQSLHDAFFPSNDD